MKTCQLWYEDFSEHESPQHAIQKAVRAFFLNPGLRGLVPTEIHLNPSQVNGLTEVRAMDFYESPLLLTVMPDRTTLFNHILVCHLEPEVETTE